MPLADLQWVRKYVSQKLGDDRIQVKRITKAVLQENADELCNVGSWIIYVIMHLLSHNTIRIFSSSPVNKVLLAYGIEGIQPLVNILVYGLNEEYVELVDNELMKEVIIRLINDIVFRLKDCIALAVTQQLLCLVY